MKYILPCRSSDPNFNSGRDVAIVELHDDDIQAIEALRKEALEFFERSPRLQALRYVSPISFELYALDVDNYCGEDALFERDHGLINQETGFLVSEDSPAPRLRHTANETIFWLIICCQGDLYWEGMPTRCAYTIRTAPLPIKP